MATAFEELRVLQEAEAVADGIWISNLQFGGHREQ
jgi:hypothetical protein